MCFTTHAQNGKKCLILSIIGKFYIVYGKTCKELAAKLSERLNLSKDLCVATSFEKWQKRLTKSTIKNRNINKKILTAKFKDNFAASSLHVFLSIDSVKFTYSQDQGFISTLYAYACMRIYM